MADFLDSTSSNGDNGGGLTDILSMALEQSGFDMLLTPTQSQTIDTLTIPPLSTDKMASTNASTVTHTSLTDSIPLLLTPTASIVDTTDNTIDINNMVDCFSGLEPSNDLSVLLNDTSLVSFVSEPSTNFTMSTPLPAHRTTAKTNAKPVPSNMSVNDVLQQLGLDTPTTLGLDTPITSVPISLSTVSGMIGSVCVTHLNNTPIR